jgi:uncharacterized protein (TIGR02118 family)
MIKVSVFYPNRKNAEFNMDYYCNTHMPLVRRLLGSSLQGVSVDSGISGEEPGSAAPYVAIGHLLFNSVESFRSSFAPYAQEISDDVPKYTNVEPTIQVNEVKL